MPETTPHRFTPDEAAHFLRTWVRVAAPDAPKLLTALERVAGIAECEADARTALAGNDDHPDTQADTREAREACEQARAAIAKARGEVRS